MYGHNFAYFDPNIWYNEDEMRKQVEQLNGCFILTGEAEKTRWTRFDLSRFPDASLLLRPGNPGHKSKTSRRLVQKVHVRGGPLVTQAWG